MNTILMTFQFQRRRLPQRVRSGACLVLLILASGCRREAHAPVHATGEQKMLQRIICGSPAITEIVFALGCGPRVVGVSDYTEYPPEARQKSCIGGIITPNRERLLAVKPDCIITQGKHDSLAAFASAYGLHFHTVKLDTLPDLFHAIRAISTVLCVEDKGRALETEMRHTLDTIASACGTAPPKRVLLLFGRTPGNLTGLNTVGPGTFLDAMIRIAGGTNIFADATGPYPQVSKEALLVRQPEVVLELHPDGLSASLRTRLSADWNALADIPAIQQAHLHYLTNNFLLIPGPRVAQIAEAFANAITNGAPRE